MSSRDAVLALYRSCLRCSKRIPSDEQRLAWTRFVQLKFDAKRDMREQARIDRAVSEAREELKQMNYYHEVREMQQRGGQRQQQNPESRQRATVPGGPGGGGPGNEGIADGEPLGQKEYTATGRSEWVSSWLLGIIPNLSENDLAVYTQALVDGGFDSEDLVVFLAETDLPGVRPGHRRAIMLAAREMRARRDKSRGGASD